MVRDLHFAICQKPRKCKTGGVHKEAFQCPFRKFSVFMLLRKKHRVPQKKGWSSFFPIQFVFVPPAPFSALLPQFWSK